MDGWWKVSGKGGIMCMRIDGMGMENRFCEDDGMVWLVVELGCGLEEYHQLTSGYWHQLQVEKENSQLKMANGSPLVPENSHYQEHECSLCRPLLNFLHFQHLSSYISTTLRFTMFPSIA